MLPLVAAVVLELAAPRGFPAGWQASMNRDTGVPAWVYGSYVAVPGATLDAARAELAARAFLATHLGVLAPGATLGDLELVANQLDGATRTVAFVQRWRGLRVVGGQLGVVIANDRLFAVKSSAWPHVRASVPGAADAATQRGRAEAWITQQTGVTARARSTGERVVWSGIERGAIRYEIADVLDVAAIAGHERWRVYVTADGRPLSREDLVMTATGTLQYNASLRHPASARADFPAAATSITVTSGSTTSTTTSSTGTFTWPGTAAATVAPGLAGTFVRVIDQGGAPATDSLAVQPGGTAVWNRASDELADAQLSTYIYANTAKARARVIHPAIASWLDMQLDFYVNESGSCNAYSTGNDVHLTRAGAMCENTGRLADVVFHEFGHSLHNNSLITGMGAFESHLSEGLSDFFAASVTGDPAVGRGFFKTDEPLRHIDPSGIERVYPLDFDFDAHVSGLIIAGALWDLRKILVAELGQTDGITRTDQIFVGVMQRANDIGTTFTAALIGDDDDADLGNGTPNYCAIERAFGNHGLVPGYERTTVAPPAVDNLQISVAVSTPSATACPPRVVTSLTVTWRANDGVASELALATGDGLTWTGAFPEQLPGTVLSYSVDAHFDDGTVLSFPQNAADPRYQHFIGPATPLWCESFDADPGWAQTSNLSFEWEWGAARADTGTPDPDAAYSGVHVLGTDLSGDALYRANLVTSIATPTLELPAFETVRLHYRRWLTVEDGAFDRATITANGVEVWSNAATLNGTLDHVDREWRFHDIDLTPTITDNTLTVRWGLSSDFGKELGGWTIDDVCIVGLVKVPRCGDGELDAYEECDDGNTDSDDGCSTTCIDEVTSGGGGCCSASGDSRGTWLLVLGVALALGRQRRASRGRG